MSLSRITAFVRVNWKKISLAFAMLAIAWLVVGFVRFIDGLSGYCNVHRTDDREEVLYRLGYPPVVMGEPEKITEMSDGYWSRAYWTDKKANPKNAMPEDKKINDYSEWSYDLGQKGEGSGSIGVAFYQPKNRVKSISCMGDTCPSLASVAIDDTEEQVQHKLGKPNRYKRDGVSKTLRYDDIGVEFILTKGRVYHLTLLEERGNAFVIMRRYLQTIF